MSMSHVPCVLLFPPQKDSLFEIPRALTPELSQLRALLRACFVVDLPRGGLGRRKSEPGLRSPGFGLGRSPFLR